MKNERVEKMMMNEFLCLFGYFRTSTDLKKKKKERLYGSWVTDFTKD